MAKNTVKLLGAVLCSVLTLLVLPVSAQTCRWDGTAPWCAGECGRGESEVLRTSDLPEHWKNAYPIVQNTNFGASCTVGSKALCCPASPGRECRWDGTAPFCDGSCGQGETEGSPPPGSLNGAACVTGSKKYCCRTGSATGVTRQPLTTNKKLTLFAGIWDKSPGPAWQARHGLDAAQYQQQFDTLARQGYRPVQISGYSVGGQPRYAAIFEQRSGSEFAAFHGLTSAQYQAQFDRLTRSGFRPVFINGFTVGNDDRYNAVFDKSASSAWVARHNIDGAAYQREFDQRLREGYRLTLVSGYQVNGQDRYAAIWEKRPSPAWAAKHGMSSTQYQQEFSRLVGQGYRVVWVEGWRAGKETRLAAIWEKSQGPAWQARHQMLADNYQETFDQLQKEGYRLRVVSGYHMYD